MEIPCEQSAVQLIIAIAAHRTAPLFRASYLNLCRGKVAGVSRLRIRLVLRLRVPRSLPARSSLWWLTLIR